MSDVIPFDFKGMEVRVTEKDGDPWFVAKDVAGALGYINTSKAVNTHCKAVGTCPTEMGGQVRHIQIIPERDVYRLVMKSQLPSAEEFEEWVVGEVLPSIRKTGSYSSNQPVSMEEILHAQSGVLLAHKQRVDQVERRIDKQEAANEQIVAKVSQLEKISQNGVPVGYIAKSKSYKIYSRGLSREVFEQALTILNVKTEKYVHTENGHSVYTFAWKECEIKSAIGFFIDNAIQTSPQTCSSPMLNGKKFRFIKKEAA